MTRFTLSLAAFVAATSLTLSSCSKKSDPAPSTPGTNPNQPTGTVYGSATFGSQSLTFKQSEVLSDNAEDGYLLANATTVGSTGYAVSIHLVERPTKSAEYILGSKNFVLVTAGDTAAEEVPYHVYQEFGDKVSVTVTNGKVKATFTNLTESNFNGGTPETPVKLSGTVSEK